MIYYNNDNNAMNVNIINDNAMNVNIMNDNAMNDNAMNINYNSYINNDVNDIGSVNLPFIIDSSTRIDSYHIIDDIERKIKKLKKIISERNVKEYKLGNRGFWKNLYGFKDNIFVSKYVDSTENIPSYKYNGPKEDFFNILLKTLTLDKIEGLLNYKKSTLDLGTINIDYIDKVSLLEHNIDIYTNKVYYHSTFAPLKNSRHLDEIDSDLKIDYNKVGYGSQINHCFHLGDLEMEKKEILAGFNLKCRTENLGLVLNMIRNERSRYN